MCRTRLTKQAGISPPMRKTKSGAVSAPKNRVCPCQSRVGVGLDAVARRLGQDAACGVVGIGDRLAVRRGLCDGAGGGVRRPGRHAADAACDRAERALS